MQQEKITYDDFALYLLVFSVTFENWNPFGLQGVFSITKMTTIFYLISSLSVFSKRVSLKYMSYYILPLLCYVISESIASLINLKYIETFYDITSFKVLQLILFMILISNHLIAKPHLNLKVLKIYVYSIALLSFLFLMGIGIDTEYTDFTSRLSLFGENPNAIGVKGAIALMIIFSLILEGKVKIFLKIVFCIFSLAIIAMISGTASRGAFILVFLGGFITVILQKITFKLKLLTILVASVIGIFMWQYFLSNKVLLKRLKETTEEGKTGRDELWTAGMNIFYDNPILGVGRSGFLKEMNIYFGLPMDTHNVFISLLATTGLIGFLFFILFFIRIWKYAFYSYKYSKSILFLIILFILTVHMSKAGGILTQIFPWFIFSIVIGATRLSKQQQYN